MKPRTRMGALAQQLSRLDQQTIDRLYGLEPVFEPMLEPGANMVGGAQVTPFIDISCPYCGEQYETQVDLSGGSFSYVEDCQICCQPIELGVQVNDAGHLLAVSAARLD